MTIDRDLETEAAGAMAMALRRLAGAYPFHAALIAAFQVSASRDVETVAVGMRGLALQLVYNPEFVARCTLLELEGVLHHEVNHVIFGHLLLDPADYPNEDALMVACEVTVNEFVTEPLPGRPIVLASYPMLPPGEDTQARYQRLASAPIRPIDDPNPGGTFPNSNRSVPSPPRRGPNSGSPEPKTSAHQRPKSVRSGAISVHPAGDSVPKKGNSAPLRPIDDHSLWAEVRDSGGLGRLVVREAVRGASRGLTKEEWSALPLSLRSGIAELLHGDQPGDALEQLDPVTEPGRVKWNTLLRRYVGRALDVRPSFARPPRRFPKMVGIVPGAAHRAGRRTVMAVIDTSGSIDASTLAQILSELRSLRQRHQVTVVECDCEIQAIYELRRGEMISEVHGRGGTDLSPPFDRKILKRIRPDLIIYFTDGCGPAPSSAPRVPVIWCLTANGVRPAVWGRLVRLA